eukprot:TRINITY_DN4786_c0_g1_i1.p1 TRINITY_DN4786_c0_g1~~TRINITY_DN4786_c0_g1_i1.p1  ORF type:complete len:174 (-),score=39.39 TRINITY_DN4786_c0_g1_i1:102-623(-)
MPEPRNTEVLNNPYTKKPASVKKGGINIIKAKNEDLIMPNTHNERKANKNHVELLKRAIEGSKKEGHNKKTATKNEAHKKAKAQPKRVPVKRQTENEKELEKLKSIAYLLDKRSKPEGYIEEKPLKLQRKVDERESSNNILLDNAGKAKNNEGSMDSDYNSLIEKYDKEIGDD